MNIIVYGRLLDAVCWSFRVLGCDSILHLRLCISCPGFPCRVGIEPWPFIKIRYSKIIDLWVDSSGPCYFSTAHPSWAKSCAVIYNGVKRFRKFLCSLCDLSCPLSDAQLMSGTPCQKVRRPKWVWVDFGYQQNLALAWQDQDNGSLNFSLRLVGWR